MTFYSHSGCRGSANAPSAALVAPARRRSATLARVVFHRVPQAAHKPTSPHLRAPLHSLTLMVTRPPPPLSLCAARPSPRPQNADPQRARPGRSHRASRAAAMPSSLLSTPPRTARHRFLSALAVCRDSRRDIGRSTALRATKTKAAEERRLSEPAAPAQRTYMSVPDRSVNRNVTHRVTRRTISRSGGIFYWRLVGFVILKKLSCALVTQPLSFS